MILPTVEDKTIAGLGKLLPRWRDTLLRWLSLPAVNERGRAIELSVSTTPVSVDHGLGARPAGWLVLRTQGASPVALAETASDERSITLVASATATITLWVWP